MSDNINHLLSGFGEAILNNLKDSQKGYSREDISMKLLETILKKHAEKSCSSAAGLLLIHQRVGYAPETDVLLRSQMYEQASDLRRLAGFYNSLDEFYTKFSDDEKHLGLTVKLQKEICSLEKQAEEIRDYLEKYEPRGI